MATTEQKKILVVFSDVDGTLVHYPEGDQGETEAATTGNRILKLPPSATGMQGSISSLTISQCQQIRRRGCKLVLVSGMRTTTLFQRLPFLPVADAYCSEAGGRIWYRVPLQKGDSGDKHQEGQPSTTFVVVPQPFYGATDQDLLPFTLKEDLAWRKTMEATDAAGADGYRGAELPHGSGNETVAPVSDRVGALWEFARLLISQGFVLDTKGYATCFRVNRKQQTTTKERFDRLLTGEAVTRPPGLATSTNLGCIDYYPVASGKKRCCQYLAHKFCQEDPMTVSSNNILSDHCVCLCDDDNDLEMAMACHHAFIPGVSSVSMEETIRKNPRRFSQTGQGHQTVAQGMQATEKALALLLERLT